MVGLAGPLGLPFLNHKMFHFLMFYKCQLPQQCLLCSSLRSGHIFIASSTVASLTSTFLGRNWLKALAYSPFARRSSGLILSLYCDGCRSTSWIL